MPVHTEHDSDALIESHTVLIGSVTMQYQAMEVCS